MDLQFPGPTGQTAPPDRLHCSGFSPATYLQGCHVLFEVFFRRRGQGRGRHAICKITRRGSVCRGQDGASEGSRPHGQCSQRAPVPAFPNPPKTTIILETAAWGCLLKR